MIKAIIFDLDGTIIDSEYLWRKAEIEVFGKRGITLSEDDCRKTIGMRQDDVVQYWADIYPEAKLNVEETNSALTKEIMRLFKEEGKAMPGVIELISNIHKLNIPMAVASASLPHMIDLAIDKIGIRKYFHSLNSSSEVEYSKPHPQIFIETAKKMGVQVSECLVIEDSVTGVIAGKAARMKVVAVPEPENFNKPEYAIADYKIASLKEFNMDWILKVCE